MIVYFSVHSDKCLNQYKMNIFCKETQAHLELHPHLREGANSGQGSSDSGGGNANLITPELWMRDCRSQSPDTDRSATPPRIPSPLVEIKTSPRRNQVVTDKKSSREGIKKKVTKSCSTIIIILGTYYIFLKIIYYVAVD